MTELDNNIITNQLEKDDHKRMKSWAEEIRDKDGILISGRRDTYKYYATGEIDEIVLKRYDKTGSLVKDTKVKHFRDGRKVECTQCMKQSSSS